MKRVILIVMDSLGVGELPDANKFGDEGSNTLAHIIDKMPNIHIPNLTKLGFLNIEGVYNETSSIKEVDGAFGKLKEKSKGKDTTTGHWEIAGIETEIPFKTYPLGFPEPFLKNFEKAIGKKVIGNYPSSGIEIIEKLGEEHEKTGSPIVYTSADSVFQIAANISVIPLEELYEICEKARELLVGEFACARVIARPYKIINGKRERTSDRKDFSVSPPEDTVLDKIKENGQEVYAVGKISDIFNGKGITKSVHTEDNMDGVDKTIEAINLDFNGLIFTNLVDFDSKYGHRRDPIGYGKAIEDLDKRIPQIIKNLKDEDILIFCADHGNDPTHTGWDHTREYIPVLIYGKNIKANINLGICETFADIGATIGNYLGIDDKLSIGKSFLKDILK